MQGYRVELHAANEGAVGKPTPLLTSSDVSSGSSQALVEGTLLPAISITSIYLSCVLLHTLQFILNFLFPTL